MNLNKWYKQGITSDEYIETLTTLRDGFFKIYNTFTIPTSDIKMIDKLTNTQVLVLAEGWCGHCMMDIPILLKIAEQGNIPIRFLPRDENLELMDNYLTNEKRVIPIFIFIDEHGNQVGQWGPIAPEVRNFVDKEKAQLPARDAANYDEALQESYDRMGNTFTTDQTLWNNIYEDILKSIK